MKKLAFLILTAAMLLSVSALAAEEKAVIQEKQGKVEVLIEGEWLPARKGMQVDLGATISTGFNSSAVLDLGDSTLTVSQLSRMTIEELSKKEGLTTTRLFLRTGKVKADVRSTAKLRHNFQFKSSVATASVRGTSFTFTPFRLTVHEGAVNFANNFGQRALVVIGQDVVADAATGVRDQKEKEFSIPQLAGEEQTEVEPESSEAPTTGSVNVTITYE